MEVYIETFITPHIFFVTEANSTHKLNFLINLSNRIEKNWIERHDAPFEIDEMVAVCHNKNFARATIQDVMLVGHKPLYCCWLIDYGILIQSDTVYKLCKELQKITPQAKQACLKNICYIKEDLELGIAGKINPLPTISPPSGVFQYCLELLSNSEKVTFEVTERYDNVLIGELNIYKNDKVFILSEELIKKQLAIIDEDFFLCIKHNTKVYMKNHLEMIHQICRSKEFKINSQTMISNINRTDSNIKEFADDRSDILNSQFLENGRRRKIFISDNQSEKNTHFNQQKISKSPEPTQPPPCSKAAYLVKKLKEKNKLASNLTVKKDVDTVDNKLSPLNNFEAVSNINKKDSNKIEQLKHKLASLKVKKQTDLSFDSITSEEGAENSSDLDSERSKNCNDLEKEKKSPFQDITSQKKNNVHNIILLPAEMTVVNKSFSKEVPKGRAKSSISESKSSFTATATDSDCATIEIPKHAPEGAMDEQFIKTDEPNQEKEHTNLSCSNPKKIFTKQEFCKLLSGGCECKECTKAYEEDDWETPINFDSTDSDNKNKIVPPVLGPIIKPPKLLKLNSEDEASEKEIQILSPDYNELSNIEKQVACKILVHGESIPNPIKVVSHVNIHQDIYNNMSRLNYKQTKKIQQYAFPAITRNQHVFMISDSRSGKTMAYLPILSSFIIEKYERYKQLLKLGGGPIVVILCSNSKKCEEIYNLSKLISNRPMSRISLATYPGRPNISNVDILITIPTVLSSLLATNAINFKRLCHLVLEDADAIFNLNNDLISKFLKYADKVLDHRHCPKSIQVIVCAEHWTQPIEDLSKSLNEVPLICIGNYLEAAIYGKMNFIMKFLETSCKEQYLTTVLRDIYKYTKSVILCNFEEIKDIETFLMLKGIEYVTISDNMDKEEIIYHEGVWNTTVPGKYSVLICTDNVYNTSLTITSALLLIHYSLPNSWSNFVKRFCCLLENIPTPLYIKENNIKISSVVLIDESCESRMVKFSSFVKKSGLEKYLCDISKQYFTRVTMQEEEDKISKGVELCELLKVFGKCNLLQCKKRHVLTKDTSCLNILPQNGTINFKIMKIISTTTCSIKILENFDLKGKSVKQFKDLTNDILDVLARQDIYQSVSKLKLNHAYLYKDEDKFFRCKLVEINEFALVFLIDSGIYCKADLNHLFEMPQELKEFPQQCYEVYFANLIPPYEDTTFSRHSCWKLQLLLDGNCPNSVMKGIIQLQLEEHLWLSDICEEREMFDKSLPSVGFQLTREMVKQGLTVKSEKPLKELYNLCKEVGIMLPEYKLVKPSSKPIVVEQVAPQWAFLNLDDITEVTFSCAVTPHEFYVRQSKFNTQLVQLEKDIQREIQKPFYPNPQKVEVGKCYLIKDEESANYSRCLILKIDNDDAHVFCVDYGDDIYVPVSTLKHITNSMISKLPFQSVQCSLFGVSPIEGIWSESATDILYDKGFEPGTTIFRSLFVKICSREKNGIIPRQNSYSVIVKDGFNERHTLLNQLLIDCGFAISSGDDINDFILPEAIVEDRVMEGINDEHIIEEIINNDNEYKFHESDIEIIDIENFLMDLKLIKPDNNKHMKTDTSRNALLPIKAVPQVDHLTPEMIWSQTESHIKIKIKVSDVQKYQVNIFNNRIFQFNTEKNEKKYYLKSILYDKVEKTFQHTALGSEVRVTLRKCNEEDWPRLLHTEEKNRKILYDVSTLIDEEKPRKFLEFGIGDSSSTDDEDDALLYVLSDLDSEYDNEIPHDTD